ncbi:hypothetical protein [Arthrobacter sp. NPDC090010]|uniref:hypothetical protein n=1 Tax=Arthrobacter sp. NPDC090010 TaxID=3363942 RepID=UPI00381239CB
MVITHQGLGAWLVEEQNTFEPSVVLEELCDLEPSEAQVLADKLIQSGVFVGAEMRSNHRHHEATRDYPFMDMSTGQDALRDDAAIMRTYLTKAANGPSPYLEIPAFAGSESIPLPRVADLTPDAIPHSELQKFSTVIVGVFGEISKTVAYEDSVSKYMQMPLLHKSIPSGGARHPLELFIQVRESPVVPSGRYHFNVRRNELTPLSSQGGYSFGSEWIIELEIAAAIERDMFRYRDPRSSRAVFVDAGHADGQLAALASYVNWDYQSAVDIDIEFGSEYLDACCLPRIMKGKLFS